MTDAPYLPSVAELWEIYEEQFCSDHPIPPETLADLRIAFYAGCRGAFHMLEHINSTIEKPETATLVYEVLKDECDVFARTRR